MNVKDANLAGASFENVNLSGASFVNINLSGARFHDINFSDVRFTAAQVGGALFKHLGPPPHLQQRQRPATFDAAILEGSVFRHVDLRNVQLVDCKTDGMTIDGVLVSDLLEAYRRRGA